MVPYKATFSLVTLALAAACTDPFVPDATRFYADIAAGAEHTCAVAENGEAYCWGKNANGQLGDGSLVDRFEPTKVFSDISFAGISAGDLHTCALTVGGSAHCWGSNFTSQLGDPRAGFSTIPLPVATALRFTAIDAGAYHNCGLATDGLVYCWGANTEGQTGLPISESTPTPATRVPGLASVVKVSAGGNHSCALTVAGDAYCWGLNDRGQLGIGSESGPSATPLRVSIGVRLMDIAAGMTHTCAVANTGIVYCWGSADLGELGDMGTAIPGGPPSAVPLLDGVVSVFAGARQSCAIDVNGLTWCWGSGAEGQLGNGEARSRNIRLPIHFVPEIQHTGDFLSFTKVALGGFTHACALAEEKSVWCWGTGTSGQLGLPQYHRITLPQRVPD